LFAAVAPRSGTVTGAAARADAGGVDAGTGGATDSEGLLHAASKTTTSSSCEWYKQEEKTRLIG
jgi:hypothetical protein